MEKQVEKRVVRDANGFWLAQIRFLPLEDWDKDGDGWRTMYISSVKENAERFAGIKEEGR